jgi:replicative DNA helicase
MDADVVLLLHREDAYERDTPRAGIVDVIVAKHRNGPTRALELANQLHLARFADLAVG